MTLPFITTLKYNGITWTAEVKDLGLVEEDRDITETLVRLQARVLQYLKEELGTQKRLDASIDDLKAKCSINVIVHEDRSLDEWGQDIEVSETAQQVDPLLLSASTPFLPTTTTAEISPNDQITFTEGPGGKTNGR